MRTAFIRALEEMAEKDDRVMLVVGDLGFGVVENFAKQFPRQYVNAGVAEQNMTGLAAGMALLDKVVFTYSIGNFPTLRCLEQIRNDVCYHKANVKVVAVGGGFTYGPLGMSHHATEDIAIMRVLPNMTVVAPGDPAEAYAATRAMVSWPGPCYLRLGRAGEQTVHKTEINFQIGEAIQICDGDDLTLISTGGFLISAVNIANQLLQHGITTRILSMHTVKPLDTEAVLKAARDTHVVATIEEHSILGGLGGAVAEVLSEFDGQKVRFKRFGVESIFATTAGSQQHLREIFEISDEIISERLLKWIHHKNHV